MARAKALALRTKGTTRRRHQHRRQRLREQGQHDLGLRIAEADVELDHLRAGRRQHQAVVKEPAVRGALGGHPVEHGPDNLALDALLQRGGHQWARAERAHPTGVRPFVVVEHSLVVLRRQEGDEILAVGDDEERDFRSCQHLLEHDACPGIAKAAIDHGGVHGGFGRRTIRRHHHALAGGQAVGLHHQRITKFSGADGGRCFFRARADPVVRGGHAVARHEVLGEGLAGLELGGGAGRAEHAPAFGGQPVGEPASERSFRAHHGEVDPLALDQLDHCVDIEDVEGDGIEGNSPASTFAKATVDRKAGRHIDAGLHMHSGVARSAE